MSRPFTVLTVAAVLLVPPLAARAEQPEQIAYDAYMFAYPLLVMDVSMRQATNVPDATTTAGRAPVNQFAHSRTYPPLTFKDVPTPNFDTLYSTAWLDLTREPIVLSVPNTDERYYVLQLLDLWTDVFDAPGWRTTGTGAGAFAIVGPGWTGKLPEGVEAIRAPTPIVWILGRTETDGIADYDAVNKVQDGYVLTPLSRWGKPHKPPENPPPLDPSVDGTTRPHVQVARMDGVTFFARFAELLKTIPTHANDYPILHRMRAIGIVPGEDFHLPAGLDPAVLDDAAAAARQYLTTHQQGVAKVVNGWTSMTENIGTYGTSYVRRALIALLGLGANLPEDAIYPNAYVDANGEPLDGARRYVVHFDAGALPPVDAFWSVTLYDSTNFPVSNSLERYALGDRDVRLNSDGSLDLYVQSDSPGAELETNWLPIGTDLSTPSDASLRRFHLTARLYAPRRDLLEGTWVMPAIQPR